LTPHFSELGLTIIPSRDPNAPTTPPDATVMNIENTYMKNTSGIGALGKLAITGQFPPRPGHGTIGKKIAIFANYFKIQAAPNLFLTRYNVEIKPEVRGRKLSRVFQLLLELPQFAGVASDWKSMIVARQALSIQDGEIFEIPYRGDGEDEPLPHPIIYQVRVVTPLSLGVTDLVNYLSGTASGPDFPQKLEVIQVLNVLFGSYPQSSDGTASIAGNRHFSIDHGKQARNIQVLGGGLESLRGYYQSVRPATGGILLNINVTHGVFFEPLRLDLLFPKMGTGNTLTLQKKLKLVRVEVIHIPAKKTKSNKNIPRVKTIFGLAHPQDGRKAGEQHPPQVKGFGAGPKDVKFWLSDVPPAAATAGAKPAGKAPKKSTGPPLPKNTYISVFDYFRNSELLW
jgi:eukaryotic translation initiation factor 2C